MVSIAIGMVFDEEITSFLMSVFANEPPGRLWEEENHAADESRADHLKP